MRERKIVQISAAGDSVIYALCDDGTVWSGNHYEWVQLPPIPQDTRPTTPTRGSDE